MDAKLARHLRPASPPASVGSIVPRFPVDFSSALCQSVVNLLSLGAERTISSACAPSATIQPQFGRNLATPNAESAPDAGGVREGVRVSPSFRRVDANTAPKWGVRKTHGPRARQKQRNWRCLTGRVSVRKPVVLGMPFSQHGVD